MKKEKEGKEEHYRMKIRNNKQERREWVQLMSTMMNPTQQVPQIIENTSGSALSISNITDESSRAIIVSLVVAKTKVTNRNHNTLVSISTEETKVGPKRQRIDENGDRSELTAPTTGSGSQSEQHDPENGDKSK